MTFRKLLFWVHLTAGCFAGVVIFIMSVTGVLLGFERQINSWVDRGFQVEAGKAHLPLEEVARHVNPDAKQSPNVTVRASATAPLEFAYGRERTLYVDPASGGVLGEASRSTRNFFSSVERIHRSLGSEMRSGPGRPITGACNLLFLFIVVSGVYLWFPKKWLAQYVRPAIWFRGGLRGRARDWNWHNTIGFWSAVPLFFIVLSGVIMSYQWANNLLYQLTGSEVPAPQGREGPGQRREGNNGQRAGRRARGQESTENFQSLEALLSVARQQNSSWRSISFRLPSAAERVVSFSIDSGNGGQPQKRSQLTVDRTSGRIVRTEGFSTFNAGRKLRTIARFLHTGEVLGLTGQVIATLASLGGAFLVWTGISLALRRLAGWIRRTRRSKVSAARQDEPVSA
jgi:uncharacterized iron-regulated membrane protein